jgi:hypothetical protein
MMLDHYEQTKNLPVGYFPEGARLLLCRGGPGRKTIVRSDKDNNYPERTVVLAF